MLSPADRNPRTPTARPTEPAQPQPAARNESPAEERRGLFGRLADVGSNVFSRVDDFVDGRVEDAQQLFGDVKDDVQGFVGDRVDDVRDGVGDVRDGVEGFVGDRVDDARGLFGGVKDALGDFVGDRVDDAKGLFGNVRDGIEDKVDDARDFFQGLPNQLADKLPDPIQSLFGLGKNDRDKLVEQTADFRSQASTVRDLQGQLDALTPRDPRFQQVRAQLDAASAKLEADYGYTAETLPAEGSLWVDPQFLNDELEGGFSASQFPTGTPVTEPPSPNDFLFGGGESINLVDAQGNGVRISSPEEYEAFVAANREASGMPRTDGEPVGVHLVMEGGGGKGKRYGAALTELYAQGVIPTSFGGASAGAIAAAIGAAGADPEQLKAIVSSPELSNLYDVDLLDTEGGLLNGNAAFDFIDQQLRELTGITDRPVTFADLEVPLQIVAAKMSDTDPAAGTEDLTQVENRMFTFSQETTPDTPVALAVRASMAIPGAFDPVQMIDPTTGREVQLVDGGLFDNLPVGYQTNDLPSVAISLYEANSNHVSANDDRQEPLPGGNIDVGNIFKNGWYSFKMMQANASHVGDWRDRTQPEAGHFSLSVPTWNLEDMDQGNSTMGFGWDPQLDPLLDTQTRDVTRDFVQGVLGDLTDPTASGTNTPWQVPEDISFSTEVQARGTTYVATYGGGDSVTFQEKGGSDSFTLEMGQDKVESIYLDNMAFDDLSFQLAEAVEDSTSWWDSIKSGQLPEIEVPFGLF